MVICIFGELSNLSRNHRAANDKPKILIAMNTMYMFREKRHKSAGAYNLGPRLGLTSTWITSDSFILKASTSRNLSNRDVGFSLDLRYDIVMRTALPPDEDNLLSSGESQKASATQSIKLRREGPVGLSIHPYTHGKL